MNNLFEYIYLEIKKIKQKAWRKFWSCNLVCEEIASSKLIKYCLFSIPILNIIQTRGVIIKFHINKFCDNPIKRFNLKQK